MAMMAMAEEWIVVEVAYALADRQQILELRVPSGTTALQAVIQSGIAGMFPEIDIENDRMGIFGRILGAGGLKPANEYVLQSRDRVEIYRPLIADPQQVRRLRAERIRSGKTA